jgi:glycerol-3-phosphate acyltransferase PlsX
MIGDFIKAEFSRNFLTKFAAIVAYPVLTAFKKRVDHRRYNGAALLGLRGLVFKSHGSADTFAFERALDRAYDAARNDLLERVRERVAHAAPLLMPLQSSAVTGAAVAVAVAETIARTASDPVPSLSTNTPA